MARHTAFGKAVKKALIDRERTGSWLVAQVRLRTGMYFDDPYLSKILSGQKSAPKVEQAIREILEIWEVL